MSSTVIDEILYYVRKRKDTYIESRLMDTVGWSCQTYNTYDKEYDYGRKGWMSERFCHCEGLLVQEYPDGSVASTWFALMPWACGSILKVCLASGGSIRATISSRFDTRFEFYNICLSSSTRRRAAGVKNLILFPDHIHLLWGQGRGDGAKSRDCCPVLSQSTDQR